MDGQAAAAGDWCHSGMHAHSSPSIVGYADFWLLGRWLADGKKHLTKRSLQSAMWLGIHRLLHELRSLFVCRPSAASRETLLDPNFEDM